MTFYLGYFNFGYSSLVDHGWVDGGDIALFMQALQAFLAANSIPIAWEFDALLDLVRFRFVPINEGVGSVAEFAEGGLIGGGEVRNNDPSSVFLRDFFDAANGDLNMVNCRLLILDQG